MSLQVRDLSIQPPAQDTELLKSIFFVSNIHCSSCVAYITEILSDIYGVQAVDVSVLTHEVRVSHICGTQPANLATALIQAAFEVHHVTTFDSKNSIVSDFETTSWLSRDSILFATQPASYSSVPSNRRHIANCEACRKEEFGSTRSDTSETASLQSTRKHPQSRSQETDAFSVTTSLAPHESESSAESLREASTNAGPSYPQSEPDQWNAHISIGGMSCASCVNSITNEVKHLDFVKDVTVNLLTNSAVVVVNGPRSNVGKVVEQIDDIGFEASLSEVRQINTPGPTAKPSTYVAEIAIGGMTCGSCAGAITRGLEELPFVIDVSVNLLSQSGRVEFEHRDQIDGIIEKIEDLGYDASLSTLHPKGSTKNDLVGKRTVSILVDGMFCHHCPDRIINSVKALQNVEADDAFSLKNPIITVTYTPHPPRFTIRDILQKIKAQHDAFNPVIHRPPTIEDRSREMQHHERRRLLSRLLFVFAVAIPTFILGIVFMSLVSSDNSVRRYLEQPMWVGSVSRMEWALFIMTTPVMFYGTDIFHVRALKEVYSLWRPGSRVPLLRRFYRFGSMNMLISAGTTVAYASSLAVLIIDAVVGSTSNTHSSTYFDTVVFLTLFILGGRFIEAYSKAKTGDAVASLGKLRPSEALLVVNTRSEGVGDEQDEIQRVSTDMLEIGDLVNIPHGASPPADGIVDTGVGQFDESSLTGESRPVKKSVEDPVYTGSVNVGQPVKIRVTAIGGSSMLDQIITVVREGQSRRAPLERIADLLTSHFVPIITLIAILTFILWLSLGLSGTLPADYLDVAHGGWTFWSLEFAVAVFVVACPCGLALAAPTALFVGGGLAARHGILVKGGGEAFQEASRLNAIVFDKTGTLTEGASLTVSDHESLISDTEKVQIAWSLAQKLEESSNHPIARAIVDFCRENHTISVMSSDIEEKSGQGMQGIFSLSAGNMNETIRYEAAIGNQRLIQTLVSPELDNSYFTNLLSKYQELGKPTTILALRQISPDSEAQTYYTPAMVFAISDSVRPDAVEVVTTLQKRNVNVFMCTGDNQTTAYAVADSVGIPRSNVAANVMPAGKADFVSRIQDGVLSPQSESEAESQRKNDGTRSIVAFVGDGVNDSPALAAADVSVAMASGSDVAMNSASFILLNSELNTILQLVVLSRRVFNRVRLNFGWALVYNLCLVPVAAGVFYPIVSGRKMEMVDGDMVMVNSHWRLSPVWAALAMALSSISVVCSSLALGIERGSIKRVFGWR
ncbi:E1-E2 ATPase-domain-containing protein [Aspergillus ambiguus]|uniref:putative copper resistance-associated P-type ATPase n=1 Tax=Aspergillus ambiguus TaxID=176160 RepID=UPI003CCDE128